MKAENPSDLAILHWEQLAEVLRSHGVSEEELRRCASHYKSGFLRGFELGFRNAEEQDEDEDEEREACVGFTHKPTAGEDSEEESDGAQVVQG